MDSYHMNRIDRQISEKAEIFEIIDRNSFMTLALCRDNEPYIVTVNYSFDRSSESLYFHCASSGKKVDFLRENPMVFGEILEDRGYIPGQCEYAYRSVHFSGKAEQIEDIEEKRRALELMIEKFEKDAEAKKGEFITDGDLETVRIYRISIESMTGKKSAGK